MSAKPVLIVLPQKDFELGEAAVPWNALKRAGHAVRFATPEGRPAQGDPRLLKGKGFGVLAPFLKTPRAERKLYLEMLKDADYNAPAPYAALKCSDYSALVLPGGHAPGMREYLGSELIHKLTAEFMAAGLPVAAICHGTLALARSGALKGRKVTVLPERWEVGIWKTTRLWLGDYYRTYPVSVEAEVREAVGDSALVFTGPPVPVRWLNRPYAIRDRNLITARWPGDLSAMSAELVGMLRR